MTPINASATRIFVSILGWYTTADAPSNAHRLTREYLLRLIKLILENIYIRVGNCVYRQSLGFPMGYHLSSAACDIYFIRYEYTHVQRAVLLRHYTVACFSRYAFRYQDDLTVIDAPGFQACLHEQAPQLASNVFWIYPLHLISIKETTVYNHDANADSELTLTFLSCQINLLRDGTLNYLKYQKVRELPFYVPSYTRWDSMVPHHSKYRVILSELTSLAMVSSTQENFIPEASRLMGVLTNENGLRMDRVCKSVELWCRDTAPFLPLSFSTDNLFIAALTHGRAFG